ncbi:type I-C CRISPR-associated protein Cas8c/Csd1 [Parapusillimonas granuli]|uniref:Type I-C CRISPR-associated protein Cas8c/Csd1 n=1 Tax=Parapusillimonas granuli TaxID=380911 RepID=A0A853G3A0_9BURK|nr:type I-C CRISPR-associated protein Cas8c/Csd1 [Parapusillimonas granuli]MBB5217543.1 CRISPR-associated protein Csd1 [Parapusillimonas granuli]NYT51828.1 type I-C CRISPR-associated protein Cas8c/Csd1 [Parapusillimonas granuli]
MSWLSELHDVYQRTQAQAADRPQPIAHTNQQVHVEIVLDAQGRLLHAEVVPKERAITLIPCTEASGGRAGSKPTAHPLCDKLQYVAGDFTARGGIVTSGFASDVTEPHRIYLELLSDWARSAYTHAKLQAILAYVRRGQVVTDLIAARVLPADGQGQLLSTWNGDRDETPAIFKVLAGNGEPQDAMVRWRVDTGGVQHGCWEDEALIEAWVRHYVSLQTQIGFCMVQGGDTPLAEQHPAKLRHAADQAKLISSNDTSGFTFRGRFLTAGQASGVGFEVTQRAHNALRWLIERRGSRRGGLVIVSWAQRTILAPNPDVGSRGLFGDELDDVSLNDERVGEAYAQRLRHALAGYRARFDDAEGVIVMALYSATLGRMAIVYYRQLPNSEFLQHLERWHLAFAWPQNYGKSLRFVGAPSPVDIAQAAYGARVDEKLEGATRARLLPCIVDGSPFPLDLVRNACQRAANRAGLDWWDWEKTLGIACALYRGAHPERNYTMALDRTRISRDYLFGRLLAVADNLEQRALSLAGENRETNAARYMAQFASHPLSTWKRLDSEQLAPYRRRLLAREPGFLIARDREIREICDLFNPDEFTDTALSGEFLLGFHCQRSALWAKGERASKAQDYAVAADIGNDTSNI